MNSNEYWVYSGNSTETYGIIVKDSKRRIPKPSGPHSRYKSVYMRTVGPKGALINVPWKKKKKLSFLKRKIKLGGMVIDHIKSNRGIMDRLNKFQDVLSIIKKYENAIPLDF